MKILEGIKTLGQNLLDLVFPIVCIKCGAADTFLCDKCLKTLPRENIQKCIVCHKPSPFGKTHADCVSRNTVDGLIAASPYSEKHIKNIIETFKYNFVSNLKGPLSLLITEAIRTQELQNYFNEFVVVPVPLHSRRHRWRGFNQAELLGEELSKNLGLILNPSLIARMKFTKPQTKLSAEKRKTNISNAFEATPQVAGRKFLLVDDVVTTGSTLNEIAKTLKKQKAAEVWAVTVARG